VKINTLYYWEATNFRILNLVYLWLTKINIEPSIRLWIAFQGFNLVHSSVHSISCRQQTQAGKQHSYGTHEGQLKESLELPPMCQQISSALVCIRLFICRIIFNNCLLTWTMEAGPEVTFITGPSPKIRASGSKCKLGPFNEWLVKLIHIFSHQIYNLNMYSLNI
jgi:hypothetical protein